VISLAILITYNGLNKDQIVKHVICLRVNGVSTFHGVKFGVIVLTMTQQAPYFIGIHCMAHKTTLQCQVCFP